MEEIFKRILFQAAIYGGVLLMAIMGMAFIFRGFFFPYLRVKASLGRLVLVNCRAVNRNFFRVGKVEESCLKFKKHKQKIDIPIPSDINCFYRCLGVSWINIDDEKNAIILADMSSIEGYDAEKYSELLERALYKPSITDNKTKLILLLQLISVIVLIVILFMIVNNGKQFTLIKNQLITIADQVKFLIPKNAVV